MPSDPLEPALEPAVVPGLPIPTRLALRVYRPAGRPSRRRLEAVQARASAVTAARERGR